jgi:hypothetical protein
MSSTTNITTTYAGEYAKKWVSAALLNATTIQNGLISVMPGIKYKTTLNKLSTGDILVDASCDFDPTGTVTITERTLEPKELHVNKVLCKKNFHNTWNSMEQGLSQHDVLPKSFADYLVGYIADKVAAKNEYNIWRGSASNAGEFDGFSTLLALDADLPSAQEVSGITLTEANIVTELKKVYAQITPEMFAQPDLAIYVSRNAYNLYQLSLGGFGASGLGANGFDAKGLNQSFGDLFFASVPLKVATGLANDVMIATYKENLVFGFGVENDQADVRVLDMSQTDASDNVRIVMKMNGGVMYASVEDIVTYGITNSAN